MGKILIMSFENFPKFPVGKRSNLLVAKCCGEHFFTYRRELINCYLHNKRPQLGKTALVAFALEGKKVEEWGVEKSTEEFWS